MQQGIQAKGFACPSASQIVPVIIGDSSKTVAKAKSFADTQVFMLCPCVHPLCRKDSSSLRISLTAQFEPY